MSVPFKMLKMCGRKLVFDRFPQLQYYTNQYVKQNSFEAHARRRGSGMCGVNLVNIRRHIHNKMPLLKQLKVKLSLSTLHRQMLPPNRRHKASRLYRSIIKAKIPRKQNNVRRFDPDAHFYFSRMKLLRNFNAHFSNDCVEVSCENKNKVHVGTLATGRMNKINKFFIDGDAPNYNDHDFPLAGYKITPMGYMFMQSNDGKSFGRQLIKDNKGRVQYKIPQSGRLFIINRAQKFHSSTIEPHVNDLLRLSKSEDLSKPIISIIVDNGPDWSCGSLINCLYFYKLFRQLELDALFIISFCPKYSAFNPIEHTWAVCTKALTSLTLPAVLPGEKIPPSAQSLSEISKKHKESVMFDLAMKLLCKQWNNMSYANFKITAMYQHCLQNNSLHDQYGDIKAKLRSVQTIRQDEFLMEEMAQMMMNLDRRIDMICFKKCTKQPVCKICEENPIRAVNALNFLNNNEHFPNPQPIATGPRTFATFHDILNGYEGEKMACDEYMRV